MSLNQVARRLSSAAAVRLLVGASLAVLSAGMAQAASYTADSEAALAAAISSANASGDASSTITITADFIIDGTVPTISRNLTIDTGAHTLHTRGNQALDVAGGVTLTVTGTTAGSPKPATSGQGRLLTSGAGTVIFSGVSGDYYGGISVEGNGGTLIIDGGSQIEMGQFVSDGSVRLTQSGAAHIVISGAGTVVTARDGTSNVGTADGATMTVEKGAVYVQQKVGLTVGGDTDSIGLLTVKNAGSKLSTGGITVTKGSGTIVVSDGGTIESSSATLAGVQTLAATGESHVVVTGEGSSWTNTGAFYNHRGDIEVLDGGELSTDSMMAGYLANATGSAHVSGSGSALRITGSGDLTLGGKAGMLAGGNGVVTVSSGGLLSVRAGAGTIKMTTTSATGTATLNIGGEAGQAATAAGMIEAADIVLGSGTATINFNLTDTLYLFDTAIVSGAGTGTINHTGPGRTRLTNDQTGFTGVSNVYGGIFEVNGGLGGTMEVAGGRLQGTGTVGTTRNAAGGTIAPGNSIGTLTVDGNYLSDGGALEIEAVLGNDASSADLLVITGDSLLGLAPTLVTVINVGGVGAETVDGIKIVDVEGTTSESGVFVLGRPAIGGAYVYELFQGTATVADGDWYLRNTEVLAPTLPTLENYPVALLGMIDLPTLRQRVGDREAAAETIWTRIEGGLAHHEGGSSTTAATYDSSLFLAQIGVEADLVSDSRGTLTGGLTAQYARHYADVYSAYGNGSNLTESLGLGATLTWRGGDGTYLDLQGQLAGFATDLDAVGYRLVEDNGGVGMAISLEVGHKAQIDDNWAITPQAQLSYASVDFDSFIDSFGSEVALERGDSLVGRLGLAIDYEEGDTRTYVIGNFTYEFLEGAAVVVSGTDLAYSGQKFGGELGVGGNIALDENGLAFHGEVLARTSFEGSHAVKGTVGLTGQL